MRLMRALGFLLLTGTVHAQELGRRPDAPKPAWPPQMGNVRIRFVDGVKFRTIEAAFKDLGGAGGIVFSDRPETFTADPFVGQEGPFTLILGQGNWTTNVPLRIGRGNNQRIFGQGPRSTILSAGPQFPANSAVLSMGKPGGTFSTVVHGIRIDANNVPGSTGLLIDGAEEDSGAFDFYIGNATYAGVRFSADQGAGTTTNMGIEQFEIGAGGTSADGVRIEESAVGRIYIRNFTINNNESEIRSDGDGIRILANPAFLYIDNGHFERYKNGVHKQGDAPTSIRDINGNETVDNLVAVDQDFTGYTLENVAAFGAGTALNDANRRIQTPGTISQFSTDGVDTEFTWGSIPYFPWMVSSSLTVGGNVTVKGSLKVNGTKSSVATLADGREVTLYAVESPDNWFEDFGAARLQDGAAVVLMDPTFVQSVNTGVDYHVFLTPNADCRGLYVARKSPTSFEVREAGGGHSNVAFDFRIVARRRGYEQVRPQVARQNQFIPGAE
jgi:hypothetical protein